LFTYRYSPIMTTPSSLQHLKELGEGLGFSGAELVEFIKEQQALERADRQAEREERDKEKERMEKQAEREAKEEEKKRQEKERDSEHREKEMKFHQAEAAEKEKERQAEAAEKEKQRQHELEQRRQELELAAADKEKERLHLAEVEEKQMQFELRKKEEEREYERLRLAAKREQREYEDAKLAREREQARFAADRAEEFEKLKHAHETEKMHTEFRMSEEAKKTPSKDHRNADSGHSGTGFIKAPKMPYFDEDKDFMDSYLNRFEQFATSQRWDPSTWALCLSALLRGRALDVYSMMAKDDVNDYEKLKSALLKRYQLTADGFRKRFRTSRPEPGESPSQFITRIGNYLQRWIDIAKAAETYDGVKKLFIEEQYLRTCPKEMATHLKEGKPETPHDLAERTETYLEAHSSDILFGVDPKFPKIRGSPTPRRCHNCGSTDHLRNQCPKPQPPTSPRNLRAPQSGFRPPGPVPKQPSYGGFKPTSPRREPPRCTHHQDQ